MNKFFVSTINNAKRYFFKNKEVVKTPVNVAIEKEKEIIQTLDCLSCMKKIGIEPPNILKPKNLEVPNMGYKPSISYKNGICSDYTENSENLDSEFNKYGLIGKYKKSINAEDLKINNEKVIAKFISNFEEPAGSIAISTKFNDAIATNGLMQCAGVSFVDKKQHVQTLLHFCPTENEDSNQAILKYILSHSKPENMEISIVPGFSELTDNSIKYLLENIDKYAKGSKIKFMQFPNEKHDILLLQHGKLMCTDGSNLTKRINPKDEIIYA